MDSDSLKRGIYFSSHSVIKEWKARHVWKVEDQTYQLQRKSLFVADAFRRPTYRWGWKASEANNACNSELSTWHRQHTFLFHVFCTRDLYTATWDKKQWCISIRLTFHAWWRTSQKPVSECLFPRPYNFTDNLLE